MHDLANLLDAILRVDWEGAQRPLVETLGGLDNDSLLMVWEQLCPLIMKETLLDQLHNDLGALSAAMRAEAEARGLELDPP
jgi:hypothetical protein